MADIDLYAKVQASGSDPLLAYIGLVKRVALHLKTRLPQVMELDELIQVGIIGLIEAQKVFESLVGLDPGNPKIIVGLLRCLTQLKKHDDAKEVMESLDDETLKNEEILKIKKLLDNLEDGGGVDLSELKSQIMNDPENTDLKFKLAEKYLSSNETEMGFNELLKIFEKKPKWNDEAAKKKLLEYFDLLGFNDPNVMEARKKLSSLMFK